MALLGQASGGFTESSSALRILHLGVRNTLGQLSSDSFTQSNPVRSTAANQTEAPGLLTNVLGVLSGSIAFTRPDAGKGFHGGPKEALANCRPLGIFINNASGNAFENTPAVASNRGPYVSSQGTYGNSLYETKNLGTNADISYTAGESLFASLNGFLTNIDDQGNAIQSETATADNSSDLIAVVKITPDSTSDELVYDQRI